jgi:Predicted transcriptional regulators
MLNDTARKPAGHGDGDALDIVAMERNAEQAARMLAALGQPKRLMVLCRLVDREMSVGALAEAVGLSQSALSQHLARLRDLGIVATRREAQTIYYSLASEDVRRMIGVLYEIFCSDGERGTPA